MTKTWINLWKERLMKAYADLNYPHRPKPGSGAAQCRSLAESEVIKIKNGANEMDPFLPELFVSTQREVQMYATEVSKP